MCVVTDRDIFVLRLFLLMSGCANIHVVSSVQRLTVDWEVWSLKYWGAKGFIFCKPEQKFCSGLPTQHHIWWKCVFVFGVRRLCREVYHSLAKCAVPRLKNSGVKILFPLYAFMVWTGTALHF